MNMPETKSDPSLQIMNRAPASEPHKPAPQHSLKEDVNPPQEYDDNRLVPAPILKQEQNHIEAEEFEIEKDIIENLLDSLGVDKMCGVDDKTLGLTDRPVPPP